MENHLAVAFLPFSLWRLHRSGFAGQSQGGRVDGVCSVRILGVDGGIASTGWAVIELPNDGQNNDLPQGQIVAAGARTFESAETDKERTPKNQIRRQYRGQRRVINRRRQRMNAIRDLFVSHQLLPTAAKDALRAPNLDPWQLRAAGLDRRLSAQEFAVALGHIARHRGFRSNAKRDRGANAAPDSSKMLSAIDATREKLSRYRTVGEMISCDPFFTGRRRNRAGDFSRSILRSDQEQETEILFKAQRRLGSELASTALETSFADKAFSQKPLQSSDAMVGPCPFETGERRAAKSSPAFEQFRLLSRLTTIKLITGRSEERLTADQISAAMDGFGKTQSLKFDGLRKRLDLDPNTRFAGVGIGEEKKRDVAARLGGCMEGTAALRKVIAAAAGDLSWQALFARGDQLDSIAAVLTFREDEREIRSGIDETGVDTPISDAIMAALQDGAFVKFKGAGHISARAARAIIPGLRRGLVYSEAAEEADYDHTAKPATAIKDIGSPVARKALSEMLKQVVAVEQVHGPFDRIHIEMARDVGKSIEERGKIERGIKDRTADKERAREDLKQLLNVTHVSANDLLRYELWKEQAGKSLYSGAPLPIQAVLETDNRVQVDHILPWSRFSDDSYINKTLCLTGENHDKEDRTPHEWITADKPSAEWDEFAARVESATIKGRKKRNFLLKDAKSVEDKFRERNLNDTRYATRVLLDELKRRYPAGDDKKQRVFARPGELTSKLRRAWGLNSLKKLPSGERTSDDRHHALDAIVVAAITNSELQRLTRAFQHAERMGLSRDFANLPEPWTGFRIEAENRHTNLTVSRAEVRRARGEAHKATIKQIRDVDGARLVFERKPIDKLNLADLDLIPVPEPYGKVADPMKLHTATVDALRTWIMDGKPKTDDRLPRSPKGDVIRKIRVQTTAKIAVEVRGGTADRGEMVRVDVFQKQNAKGTRQFFTIPIYPHEVAECSDPPNRAVQTGGIAKWPVIDVSYDFLWSVYPMSLLQLTKSEGETIIGYFRGLDTNTGAFKISPVNDLSLDLIKKGIGVRTLLDFKKLTIDRLGNIAEVAPEVRTWRGKVCT
jgi:CRISPR-associated endonuclease Csn1